MSVPISCAAEPRRGPAAASSLLLLALGVAACGGPARLDPVALVDPFIGTATHGHVYPGATVPFGMVQVSPDNGRSGWDWVSGYHYSDSIIVGFGHTHLSGTGIGDLADVLIMPVSSPMQIDRAYRDRDDRDYRSRFSHERESAAPGYYTVFLDDPRIGVELTATERVGVHRYAYPVSDDAGIVIDLGFAINWDAPTDTYLKAESDTLVVGHRFSTGWAKDERVFFAVALSKPFTAVELADGTARIAGREASGKAVKGLFRFATADGERVLLKVGISYVDAAGALRNLQTEVPGWDFDGVRAAATDAWREALSPVRIRTDDSARARTFYTALYHTKLAPIRFDDVDGRYRGGDGAIHQADGFRNYSIFSLWDTFRAAHPLHTLTEPARVDDMMRSMLAFADEYGLLPVWSLVGNETNTMTGYHAIPVLADAYLKGFRGFDGERALDAMIASAMQDHRGLRYYREYGYIPSELEPESVTKTLEYAFDDWAIAQMAAALGRSDDEATFRARSRSFEALFDPGSGFMRGKSAAGAWVEPFDPVQSSHRVNTDYTEGNAWQHSWFVPHDVARLIALMGGDRAFVAKLDSLFAADTVVTGERVSPDISGMIGQYAHGNEPSHHIAYLYAYAGAPWKTQETVQRIVDELYSDRPEGLAGNEDCGQMSAWYVFSALGFYPVNPVGGIYVIGSPLFERAEIDLPDGRTFRVDAPGASDVNRYVRGATLNGKPLDRVYITHEEIVAGGTLTLVMGQDPDRSWGAAFDSRPPSASSLDRAALADSVKAEFLHAWQGYRQFAWGHDQLRPLSHGFRDWYGASLVMTPLDAFDTMLLMGLDAEAQEAKQLILDSLDFDRDVPVQVFEVTIRMLGGLITAYQMDGDPRFLELATDLATRLLPAFESATGMPYVRVNLRTGAREWQVNNPAEIGTLMLEFGTLSKLTGDPTYYDTAKRAVAAVFERRSPIGLVGTTIDVETGEWKNPDSHVTGMIDSYYEYLLKSWLLFDDPDFKTMWDASIASVNRWLPDSISTGFWYGHVDMNTGVRTATEVGALDAFLPAVLALGGDVPRAERLMTSVYRMWTDFGIEPEVLDYRTMRVLHPQYVLRPEAIESAYYLWRETGDARYLEMGRAMFDAIVRHCRAETGYAALASVLTMEQADAMESFFLAETLKYAYLLFAPDSVLPYGSVVFNTEAHPIVRTWQ
ncbi:MAG: GH92 family glycosyl hydrolase [Gemmatimonadales bacterium]|nr:GH92 family glycosyl hydrolase [Gemmatimonadales bacterium]